MPTKCEISTHHYGVQLAQAADLPCGTWVHRRWIFLCERTQVERENGSNFSWYICTLGSSWWQFFSGGKNYEVTAAAALTDVSIIG